MARGMCHSEPKPRPDLVMNAYKVEAAGVVSAAVYVEI